MSDAIRNQATLHDLHNQREELLRQLAHVEVEIARRHEGVLSGEYTVEIVVEANSEAITDDLEEYMQDELNKEVE